MDKRGQATDMPLMAGKLLLFIFVALILFSIFYGLWEIAVKEPITAAVRDRDTVAREIVTLRPDQKAAAVSTSKTAYILHLFGAGNSQADCGARPCLCVEEEGKMKCAFIENVKEQCDKDLCAARGTHDQLTISPGKEIPICRKNNAIHLGTC